MSQGILELVASDMVWDFIVDPIVTTVYISSNHCRCLVHFFGSLCIECRKMSNFSFFCWIINCIN